MIINNSQYIVWWRRIQFLWHVCHVVYSKNTGKEYNNKNKN